MQGHNHERRIQLRMLLERQCVELFAVVRERVPLPCDFTLYLVDFGEHGNIAYKSTLKFETLKTSIQNMLDRRDGKDHKSAGAFSEFFFDQLHRELEPQVPAGVGYILIFGDATARGYLASVEREGATEALRKLLEELKLEEVYGEQREAIN